jgi:hypothetical protein
MSTQEKADWENVDPLENDEVRTQDMFEEKDDPDTTQVWMCVGFDQGQ